MGMSDTASRVSSRRAELEWPTWLALAGCYCVWGLALWQHELLGWLWCIPGALTIAFHSSLQHEALHGHPTRSGGLNEAVVFPALGLFIPYRRFKQLHLKHHNDDRLTDPYDDPESNYVADGNWRSGGKILRLLLRINATFAGRMTIGPALAIFAFCRDECRALWRGDTGVRDAWIRHVLGLVPVVLLVEAAGMPFWFYLMFGAYPGYALIMMRSFVEHRAAVEVGHRTAIVDGCPLTRLLFLNNNFHAVHHVHPRLPWYRIPAVWRTEKKEILARNGAYHLGGYGAIAGRWLIRAREPVVHPFAGGDKGG